MKKRPPKTVYVSRDGKYLSASERWEDQTERGKVTHVGVYTLERVIEVTAQARVIRNAGPK